MFDATGVSTAELERLKAPSLDGRALVAGYPDAALLAGAGGHLVVANGPAEPIGQALSDGVVPLLSEAVGSVIRDQAPENISIKLPAPDGGDRVFELSVIPLGGAEQGLALVLGRETTLDKNLVAALMASRQLFRDLVSCSSDFAWETDAKGAINYVSPRGALGFSARQLNGRPAADLLAHEQTSPGPSPFHTRKPMEDVELWLTDAHGEPACLITSSLPVYDDAGVWVGVRGVCRDVTQDRAREQALAGARDRERLLGKIVDAMRNDLVSSAMLRTVAEATAWSVDASHAWVLRTDGGGAFTTAAQVKVMPGDDDDMSDVFEAMAGPLAELADRIDDQDEAIVTKLDGIELLALPTRYRGSVNGAICFARPREAGPFASEAQALVRGVAAQLGIGLEQMRNQEILERLSRTDELTGLLNRRAFFADVVVRLQAHNRSGRSATMIYLDLDNFKQVNDTSGHDAGDAVLRALSEVLVLSIRAGDQAVRFGGDEFGLWLEETDEAGAAAKAEALLAAMPKVQTAAGDGAPAMNLSIGIAVTDPARPEALEDLVTRADQGMYQAKRAGKGTYRSVKLETDEGD